MAGLSVGDYVRNVETGRAGKIVEVSADDELLPYKVVFLDPHVLPHSDWFSEANIKLCHETRAEVEAEEAAKAKAAEEAAAPVDVSAASPQVVQVASPISIKTHLSLAWVDYIKAVCAEAGDDEPAADVLGEVIGHFEALGFHTPKSAQHTQLEDLELDKAEMTPTAKALIQQLCSLFAVQVEPLVQSTYVAQVPAYATIPTSTVVTAAPTTVLHQRSIYPSWRVAVTAAPTVVRQRSISPSRSVVVAAPPITVVRQRSISPSRLVMVAAAPTSVVRQRSISPSRPVVIAAAPTTVVRQPSISPSRPVVVATAPTTVVRQRSISPSRVVQVASPTYVAAAPTYTAVHTYAAAPTSTGGLPVMAIPTWRSR